MYYNDYENYMRNILGYPNSNDSTYQGYSDGYNDMNYNMSCGNVCYNDMTCCNMKSNQYLNRNSSMAVEDIEQMYPEIYKIINPMVCQMCDNNTQPINERLIEQMTNNIYDNVTNRIEIEKVININVETREADMDDKVGDKCDSNLNSSSRSVSSSLGSTNSSIISNNKINNPKNKGNMGETRNTNSEIAGNSSETRSTSSQSQSQRDNRLLRDLIRILIINRLLRPQRPNRPPFRPGPGGRPDMPGPGYGPRPSMYRMSNEYMPYI